jgi:hypothetical protein
MGEVEAPDKAAAMEKAAAEFKVLAMRLTALSRRRWCQSSSNLATGKDQAPRRGAPESLVPAQRE